MISEELKELLQHYGTLTVTFSHLASERPGSEYASLDEYYKSLGPHLPDEPVLVVKVSKDRESRFLNGQTHEVDFGSEERTSITNVSVWELPEDEFWYFQAFRPGLFNLEKDLPPFLYAMTIIDAYAVFEGYLSEILRMQLRRHPQLMGCSGQVLYEDIFNASSKEALMEKLIDRHVKELMNLPILDLIQKMRNKMGFHALGESYIDQVRYLSLVRNCLIHNRGRVSQKLANCRSTLQEGQAICLRMQDTTEAINILRKFAYEVDQALHAG